MSQTVPLFPTAPSAAAPETTRVPSPAERVQDSATRAATVVPGVHALGSPGGRALVRALGRVPGGRATYGSGVSVEVGPESVALDLSLVLENGRSAVEVADQVRRSVRTAVAADTGLRVLEVNVTVADVHDPADDLPPVPEPEPAPETQPEPEPETAAEREPELEPEPGPEPGNASPPVVAAPVVIAEQVVVVQAEVDPAS